MMNRRSLLKLSALGGGTAALAPFFQHLALADTRGATGQMPLRFVFVVKASGLQAE